MQPALQGVLIVLLPLLGLTLPGTLKQDKYSPLMNAIISGVVVVLASIATGYTKDQFGPNFFIDTAVVLAGISALLAGPLKGLDAYLQSNVFGLIEQQLPAITQAVTALGTSSALSVPSVATMGNALIHIANVDTLHVNQTATPTSGVEMSVNTATPIDVATKVTSVLPVSDAVKVAEASVNAASVVNTPEDAGQVTQKVVAVNPAQVSG